MEGRRRALFDRAPGRAAKRCREPTARCPARQCASSGPLEQRTLTALARLGVWSSFGDGAVAERARVGAIGFLVSRQLALGVFGIDDEAALEHARHAPDWRS